MEDFEITSRTFKIIQNKLSTLAFSPYLADEKVELTVQIERIDKIMNILDKVVNLQEKFT